MTDRLSEKQIDAMIVAYLDGSLSDADRPAFEAWLRASAENPRRVARLSITDFALREICEDTKADYLLDVLNQIDDASGPAELVTLHQIKAAAPNYSLYAIAGSIAAVLVLAVVLAVVLSGPSDTPQIADDTNQLDTARGTQPTPAVPFVRRTVATLTAERDAVWSANSAEGALAPGPLLRAGQKLTLTQGFAEITTASGAIVILEAPTTIEMLDKNNAIRLHKGKLVGICETQSSKGFIVRTPHMDVIDIGTQFGVDATQPEVTEVHVLRGEVEVARPANLDEPLQEPIRIVQGQAIRARAQSAEFVSIPPKYQHFTERLDIYRLPGTAATIHKGARTDSEWRLIAVNEERLEKPVPLTISTPRGSSQTTPNLPGIARWVRVDDTAKYQGDEKAVYTIQTNFIVPQQIDLDTAVLRIDFHADDRLEGLQFNGRPYVGWEQAEQEKNGKGTAEIPLRDVLISHGINGVNLNISNVPTTDLYLHIAWLIENPNGD